MTNKPQDEIPRDSRRLSQTGERVVLVMPEELANGSQQEKNNLADIWRALWAGKWLIAAIALLFTAGGIAYALSAQQWYRAEVLMLTVSDRSSNSLMSHLGQLGGLASLAGLNIGSNNENTEPLAVLRSKEFARSFIEEQHLITVLLADKWDARAGHWKGDPKTWPDIRDAVKYFDSNVRKIQEDKKTGLVGLSIEWKDPKLATQWVNLMVDKINERMRQRALQEANTNVHYLQEELTTSSVVALQQAIGRLLENEMEKLMVARGNQEFAFRVVDRASVPKWRSAPNRPQVTILAFVFGGLVGCLVVYIRSQMSSKRSRGAQ